MTMQADMVMCKFVHCILKPTGVCDLSGTVSIQEENPPPPTAEAALGNEGGLVRAWYSKERMTDHPHCTSFAPVSNELEKSDLLCSILGHKLQRLLQRIVEQCRYY